MGMNAFGSRRMRQSAIHGGIVAFATVASLLLFSVASGCGKGSAEDRRMLKDAHLVTPYLNKKPSVKNGGFAVGRAKDGTVVLGFDGEAFWIKDGQAYAVNESAKSIAPELPMAPDGITFEDVVLALGRSGQ